MILDVRYTTTPAVSMVGLKVGLGDGREGGLLKLGVTGWHAAPITLPADAQEFAIGDVHGHAQLLGALLDAMAAVARPGAHLTLLGDLIDRGPASMATLRLAAMPPEALGFTASTWLLGNHEMAMLMAMEATPEAIDAQALWVANGGDTTLAEAGLTPEELALNPGQAHASLRLAIGPRARARLDGAGLWREAGNLLFVHAGVDPRVDLHAFLDAPRLRIADENHPAWIRDGFLEHEAPFQGGRIVVHGHTPEPRVLRRKGRKAPLGTHLLDGHRLGLDGGSYGTGVVAGAEFRDGRYRVFTASLA